MPHTKESYLRPRCWCCKYYVPLRVFTQERPGCTSCRMKFVNPDDPHWTPKNLAKGAWWNGIRWVADRPFEPLTDAYHPDWLVWVGVAKEPPLAAAAKTLPGFSKEQIEALQRSLDPSPSSPEIKYSTTPVPNDRQIRHYLSQKESAVSKTIQLPDFEPSPVRRAVYIGRDAWSDMIHIVDACPIEVSWLGLVEETEFGPYVSEVLLPKQVCSPVGTELDIPDMARIKFERHRAKLPNNVQFWGHSHVDMGATFSGVDVRKMAEWGGDCKAGDPDWFINLVTNKRREYQCVIEIFKPVRLSIDVPVHVGDPRRGAAGWKKAVDAAVTRGQVEHRYSDRVEPARIRRA